MISFQGREAAVTQLEPENDGAMSYICDEGKALAAGAEFLLLVALHRIVQARRRGKAVNTYHLCCTTLIPNSKRNWVKCK